MRILGIMASPKGTKSQTLRLMNAVLAGAEKAGAEVELVDVCALRIQYCTACGTCYVKGRCPLRDDFQTVLDKIVACDGLVLGSPDYFRSVTAQMKTLIDRMSDAVHCQLLTGKYGCAVAVAGGPDHKEVTDYLNGLIVVFGASAVGAVGAAASAPGGLDAAEPAAAALGQSLAQAIATHRAYPEQAGMHAAMRGRFRALVTMNKDAWVHEYRYWQTMGWL